MPITKTPIHIDLQEFELRMVIHGLVCERDALIKTSKSCEGMPHFQTYTEGKVRLYERLIERFTLAR